MNYANGNDGDELIPGQGQGLDLHRYWKILFAKRWMIIGLTIAITAIAFTVIYNIPSRYQATASLVFEVDQANPISVEEIYDIGSQRREYILTQTQMLQSRQLAERVIQRLNLLEHPEFVKPSNDTPLSLLTGTAEPPTSSGSDNTAIDLDKVTTGFLKRLTIEPVRSTNLVRVKFDAKSAELAARIANTLVEEFIIAQSEAKDQFTNRATSWLNERLATLHQKLETSEKNLQAFRESEDIVDISGVRGLAERDLNATTTQLQEMRRELQQIASVYDQFKSLEGNEMALANLPEVISNPLIQEIKRNEAIAERNVADLSQRYKPKHPEMIAANNELEMVRNQLANEVRILADAKESQYKTALARVEAQEQEVERAKENYQRVSQKEFRYQELIREVGVNRQLYETFYTRVNETQETSGFEIAPAKLVDPAVIPHHPTEPNKKLLAALAVAMALTVSIALAILLDLLHLGIRGPEDVEVYLGQRLMGLLPEAEKPKNKKLDLRTFFDPEQHTFSEAVRTLRTGVVLTGLGHPLQTIVITSSVPAEGKTTAAENLAFALAQTEKVLLIDADLRKPVIGVDFEINRDHPGLTNLIEGTSSVEDCIYHDGLSELDVMSAGTYFPDPQKLLVSPRFSEIIKELTESYDRIIIDTPPVQAVSDALIISQLADALLYVVKYDSTNKRTVTRGIDRFMQIGARVDGVVLTHVDTSKDAIYADEYYDYGYGRNMRNQALQIDAADYGKPDTYERDEAEEPESSELDNASEAESSELGEEDFAESSEINDDEQSESSRLNEEERSGSSRLCSEGETESCTLDEDEKPEPPGLREEEKLEPSELSEDQAAESSELSDEESEPPEPNGEETNESNDLSEEDEAETVEEDPRA